MRFVRAVWKLLVGVKDALVLLVMLMFFGLLYAGLSAGPRPLGDGVLLMALDGSLVEQPSRPGTTELVGRQRRIREYRLSRHGRGARCGAGRRPRQGGGARPRQLPRRRPDRDRDAGRGDRPVRASGQAGDRLRHRLHRRWLSARGARVRGVDEPAGRGRDCRAGRHRTSITRACSTGSASPRISSASAPTRARSSLTR